VSLLSFVDFVFCGARNRKEAEKKKSFIGVVVVAPGWADHSMLWLKDQHGLWLGAFLTGKRG
jgi:hypothetical protein